MAKLLKWSDSLFVPNDEASRRASLITRQLILPNFPPKLTLKRGEAPRTPMR